MPKFFALDGSTVREAKKVFVNDGGTIREAKKIFALDGSTVRQVFDSFSFAFRGAKSITSSAANNVGFNFHFTNGQGWPKNGSTTPTNQGTWDPQVGDLIILAQVSSRHFSMDENTPNGYTKMDGYSVWYGNIAGDGAATYTSQEEVPCKGGPCYATRTHSLAFSICYRVLDGSSFTIDNTDSIHGFGGSYTDLVAATATQGYSNAGGGHGLAMIAQLYRPTATGYSIAGTQVNEGPTPSDSVLSDQTISAQTDDAVIQWAFGASGSNVSTAQTLTTSTGASTTTANVAGNVSGSLVSLPNNAENTATAVDRGLVNYLTSGSIRITAP